MKPSLLITGKNLDKIKKMYSLLENNYKLCIEEWTDITKQSKKILDMVDIIFCEGCDGNAQWYSHHKRQHQKFILRINPCDFTKKWIGKIDFSNINKIIVPSDKFLEREILKDHLDKCITIQNGVAGGYGLSNKLENFQVNIGVLNYDNKKSNPIKAIEFLDNLNKQGNIHYKLYFNGKNMLHSNDKDYFSDFFEMILSRLNIDIFIDNNASVEWYKNIGFVLDLSDEDNSYNLLEGMINGCIPISINDKNFIDIPKYDLINGKQFTRIDRLSCIKLASEYSISKVFSRLNNLINSIDFPIKFQKLSILCSDLIKQMSLNGDKKISISYKKLNNSIATAKYFRKDTINLSHIKEIISVKYGKNDDWQNVTDEFFFTNNLNLVEDSVNTLYNYLDHSINEFEVDQVSIITEIANSTLVINVDSDLNKSNGTTIMIINLMNILMENNNHLILVLKYKLDDLFFNNMVYHNYKIIDNIDDITTELIKYSNTCNYYFIYNPKLVDFLSYSEIKSKCLLYDYGLSLEEKFEIIPLINCIVTQNEKSYREMIEIGIDAEKIVYEKFSYLYSDNNDDQDDDQDDGQYDDQDNKYNSKVTKIIYVDTLKEEYNFLKLLTDYEIAKINNNIILTICYGKIEGSPSFVKLVRKKIASGIDGIIFKYGLSYREKCIEISKNKYGLCWNNNNNKNKYESYNIETITSFDNLIMEPYKSLFCKIYLRFVIFVPYCELFSPFILECLNSIDNQNYVNYDVVIINDGDINTNNLKKLKTFIENRENFTILNYNDNNGPAFSKSEFIKYIQNSNKYSPNDIVLVVDGDDYLINNNALLILNRYYVTYKCWTTCGNYQGKWSEKMEENFENFINKNNSERRKSKEFSFPHPRTCKLGVLKNINTEIFKNPKTGAYIQKGTDMVMFLDVIEQCGKEKIKFVNETLYYYREHKYNSYKTITANEKEETIDYISKLPVSAEINRNQIHLILATYNRKNLDSIFDMLTKQKNVCPILHLIDNNTDPENFKYIDDCMLKFQSKLNIILYRYNFNYHCFSRIKIAQDLLQTYLLDYVIIFDDDQIFEIDWLNYYMINAKPLNISSWYGKNFTGENYFESNIAFHELRDKRREEITHFQYFGPGGSIIDGNLFLLPELNSFDKYSYDVIKIDDLWMSYIFSKYLSINFNRLLYPPSKIIDREDVENTTWFNIKNAKQQFFEKLIHNYNWELEKKNKLITLNDYFDQIYVLNLKKDITKRNMMRDKLLKLGIVAKFVEAHNGNECQDCIDTIKSYQERKINDPFLHPKQKLYWNDTKKEFDVFLLRSPGTIGIMKTMIEILSDAIKNKYDKIMVFQDDVIFDYKFNLKFHNFISGFNENWSILNLGTNQTNHNYELIDNKYYNATTCTYGSFAQAFKKNIFEKIVYRLKTKNISFDKLLAEEFREHYYCIFPSICIQDITKSGSGMGDRDLIEVKNEYDPKKLRWNLNEMDFKPYWDIEVSVVYRGEKLNVNFYYYNYKLMHYDDFCNSSNESDYVMLIDNSYEEGKQIIFDKNLIGKMIFKIKNETNLDRIKSVEYEFDAKNYTNFFETYIESNFYNLKNITSCNSRAILFSDCKDLVNYSEKNKLFATNKDCYVTLE